ncbi:MAG: hypothetical protein KKD17_02130 [Nanoarchaeota archaeon]|nr:hypothetical protein [Nanoarchaeota archaeon]
MTTYNTTYCFSPERAAEDDCSRETPAQGSYRTIGRVNLIKVPKEAARAEPDEEQKRIRRLVEDYMLDRDN